MTFRVVFVQVLGSILIQCLVRL